MKKKLFLKKINLVLNLIHQIHFLLIYLHIEAD